MERLRACANGCYQRVIDRILVYDRHARPIVRANEGHACIVVVLVGHGQTHESRVRLIGLGDERSRVGELYHNRNRSSFPVCVCVCTQRMFANVMERVQYSRERGYSSQQLERPLSFHSSRTCRRRTATAADERSHGRTRRRRRQGHTTAENITNAFLSFSSSYFRIVRQEG